MKKRLRSTIDDSEIWDRFRAVFESVFAEQQRATGLHSTRSSPHMAPTAVTTVPEVTVTISTTIHSTKFVTVTAKPVAVSGFPSGTVSWYIPGSVLQSASSNTNEVDSPTRLPSIVTETPESTISTISTSLIPTTTATAINPDSNDAPQDGRKREIVGGLSGSIAGLVVIGVVICIVLRMRRRKRRWSNDASSESLNEKSPRPGFVRKWTGLSSVAASRGSPKQTIEISATEWPATVDEESRIIRMNTRHWPRPFAPGEGEGMRESVPPGQLRVVNPDTSRPDTSRRSSETASNFIRRHRSVLAGLVWGPQRALSNANTRPQGSVQPDLPTITVVEPALSREWIVPHSRTPSFQSYPSVSSLAVVTQRPPEDPFHTPLEETGNAPGANGQAASKTESIKTGISTRPSLATLQSAAGLASRALSHLTNQFLHPLRSRADSNKESTAIPNLRGISHFSYSSNGSRRSRRSDPFDLSWRGAASPDPRAASEFKRKSGNSNWLLYEGT